MIFVMPQGRENTNYEITSPGAYPQALLETESSRIGKIIRIGSKGSPRKKYSGPRMRRVDRQIYKEYYNRESPVAIWKMLELKSGGSEGTGNVSFRDKDDVDMRRQLNHEKSDERKQRTCY